MGLCHWLGREAGVPRPPSDWLGASPSLWEATAFLAGIDAPVPNASRARKSLRGQERVPAARATMARKEGGGLLSTAQSVWLSPSSHQCYIGKIVMEKVEFIGLKLSMFMAYL